MKVLKIPSNILNKNEHIRYSTDYVTNNIILLPRHGNMVFDAGVELSLRDEKNHNESINDSLPVTDPNNVLKCTDYLVETNDTLCRKFVDRNNIVYINEKYVKFFHLKFIDVRYADSDREVKIRPIVFDFVGKRASIMPVLLDEKYY